MMKNLDNYTLKDVYQENKNVFRGYYINNNNVLRVEVLSNISQNDANHSMNAEIARIKGIYDDSGAPYPGIISNIITCNGAYKPSFNTSVAGSDLKIFYFTGYLNSRLTFGSCIEDQLAYKGHLAFFYCSKQKKEYQLEIIAPRADFEASAAKYQEMLKSITCR